MTRIRQIIVIIIVFSITAILAIYLDGRSIRILPQSWWAYFSHWQYSAISKVEEIREELPQLLSKLPVPDNPQLTVSSPSNIDAPPVHGNRYICSPAKVPIVDKPGTQIYKWVGEDGITNLTNIRPAQLPEDVQQINFASVGKDYFNYRVSYPSGWHGSANINNVAENSATVIYEILSGLIGLSNMSKSSIDLLIYSNEKSYQEYKNKIAPTLAATVNGFYNSGNNVAVVLHRGNPQETIRVALHETVHVINHASFGLMPDWLNEGLADYFSGLSVAGSIKSIQPLSDRQRAIDRNLNRVSLAQLFGLQNAILDQRDREMFYGISWGTVYFLMEAQNRKLMAILLREMSKDKCQELDMVTFFNENYPGGFTRLQASWRNYLGQKKLPHNY